MKVLCIINDDGYRFLTEGKWYSVIDESNQRYRIINDWGYKDWHNKSKFKTQTEVREDKLKEIGI